MSRPVSFPYERVLTPLGFVWIPVARVKISNGARSLEMDMVVDTGADLTMIPYPFGLDLQLKPAHGDVMTLNGISGSTPYLLRTVQLTIGSIRLRTRIAWSQLEDVPAIFGRTDGLEKLVARFDGVRRRVSLSQG